MDGNNAHYMFSSRYEERKTFEYLRNVITSKYMRMQAESIITFTAEILGRKAISKMVEADCPENLKIGEFANWAKGLVPRHEITGPRAVSLVKNHILPYVLQRLERMPLQGNRDVEKRLEAIRTTFNLSNEEVAIITFYFLLRTCLVFPEFFDGRYNALNMTETVKLKTIGDVVLGLPRKGFFKVFERGILFQSGIIDRSCGCSHVELCQWCVDYLCGIDGINLTNKFFTLKNDEPLQLSDFDITEDDLLVLDGLLKRSAGCNILFYGTAGTGKSAFSRSLARYYGKKLYSVKVSEKDSVKDRLLAIFAAVNLAGQRDSVVLVDEADEILNTEFNSPGENFTTKSWINSFLDGHEKKIIWISNRSEQIDSSTMRRFTFSLEFRDFNPEKRLKVLKHALSIKGVPDSYFTEEELKDLCRSYSVNAAGIVNAIDSMTFDRRTKKSLILRRIKRILKNHEKAIGNAKTLGKVRSFEHYSLDGLNTSVNLGEIVNAMKKNMNREGADNPTRVQAVSMLLYGMPGTGKTEFANYLGYVLGKEILLRRVSDIHDMYVGQTEKNIAAAFRQAQDENSILFFDEADSFFYPRKDAVRSWEKSFTNEILTQLENYRGVVIFATNDIDGLDQAALRRFGFKIRFDPLTTEGILNFYNTMLKPFVTGAISLTYEQQKQLAQMQNLTPGDFAVVRNNCSLLQQDNVTHRALIEALSNEVRIKKNLAKVVVGF